MWRKRASEVSLSVRKRQFLESELRGWRPQVESLGVMCHGGTTPAGRAEASTKFVPFSSPSHPRVGGGGGGAPAPTPLAGHCWRQKGDGAPHRPDKACARPAPGLAAPPRVPPSIAGPKRCTQCPSPAPPPSQPPQPMEMALGGAWLFRGKKDLARKSGPDFAGSGGRGGAGSSPRRGLQPWARAAAAACLPGHAGRERHGRGPRGRPARAGAGGPARGGRAAAARLLADRHHLRRARCRRPAGPRRPRRAARRPPRPRRAALRHTAGAPTRA